MGLAVAMVSGARFAVKHSILLVIDAITSPGVCVNAPSCEVHRGTNIARLDVDDQEINDFL
jgi:hypothetical protein